MSLSRLEELLIQGSYSGVIGIDEAGRGPLAGPVVAAACCIIGNVNIDGINDSKLTSEKDREDTFHLLTNSPQVYWAATIMDHKVIDEINILEATLRAMRESCAKVLEKVKISKIGDEIITSKLIALVDGNRIPTDMPIEAKHVIKGDSIVYSIAAASIIAKVTRDRIMIELSREYPQYNFAKHKGYPTAEHRAALVKFGPSSVHRLSYRPVRESLDEMKRRSVIELLTQEKRVNAKGVEIMSPIVKKRSQITNDDDVIHLSPRKSTRLVFESDR